MIDTSVFAAAERGKIDLKATMGGRLGQWFGMAAITASELLTSTHWTGRTPVQRKTSEQYVEGLLGSFPVVPFDVAIARQHARLYAELKANGAMVGLHDLQIAATALVLGQPVATRDERSFPRIPGLTVERW